MPVAGFHIPVVTGQYGIAGTRGEIENLEGRVVGGREEFGVAWSPGKVANRVVVCIVDCFDVVKVWAPIFNVTSLSTRNEPFLTM